MDVKIVHAKWNATKPIELCLFQYAQLFVTCSRTREENPSAKIATVCCFSRAVQSTNILSPTKYIRGCSSARSVSRSSYFAYCIDRGSDPCSIKEISRGCRTFQRGVGIYVEMSGDGDIQFDTRKRKKDKTQKEIRQKRNMPSLVSKGDGMAGPAIHLYSRRDELSCQCWYGQEIRHQKIISVVVSAIFGSELVLKTRYYVYV